MHQKTNAKKKCRPCDNIQLFRQNIITVIPVTVEDLFVLIARLGLLLLQKKNYTRVAAVRVKVPY